MSEKKYCIDCKYNEIIFIASSPLTMDGNFFICGHQYNTYLHPGPYTMDSLMARLDPDACGPGARYWRAKDE